MKTIFKILGILALVLDLSSVVVSAGSCGRKLKMKKSKHGYYYPPEQIMDDDCVDDDFVSSSKGMSMSMMRSRAKASGKGRNPPTVEGYFIFLTIVNLALQQPFSAFFVMVHDASVVPLYNIGQAPSANLTVLAEEGDPDPLVQQYSNHSGVLSAVSFSTGAPFFVGQELIIPVFVTDDFSHITIAAKALNTNDAFVALNGIVLGPGDSVTVPAYDAGSEENNELCSSIPGPACTPLGTVRSLNGEGVVHVARGIHGIGNLSEAVYDWRNPMMLVTVE